MSDLTEWLRTQCNCNIDTSPCGSEEECRIMFKTADTIDEKDAEIERLRALVEEMAGALGAAIKDSDWGLEDGDEYPPWVEQAHDAFVKWRQEQDR